MCGVIRISLKGTKPIKEGVREDQWTTLYCSMFAGWQEGSGNIAERMRAFTETSGNTLQILSED